MKQLWKEAHKVRVKYRGNYVYFRGLIELSNICTKNCLYCGIRRDNHNVQRYQISKEAIINSAKVALDLGYGSVVLQSGERNDSNFIDLISSVLHSIKNLKPDFIPGITLSLGEYPLEVYKEWHKMGATRYLLRVETTKEPLYNALHPDNTLSDRIAALERLKEAGYIVGSGVMIGIPGQQVEDLDKDIDFFKRFGVNMVGMGPYIPHLDTEMGQKNPIKSKEELLELSIDTIAKLRLAMPRINIAATTALQVLHPLARERALMAGANVVMPNVTEIEFKRNYQLYGGKVGVEDDIISTKDKLVNNLSKLKLDIGWGMVGNPE